MRHGQRIWRHLTNGNTDSNSTQSLQKTTGDELSLFHLFLVCMKKCVRMEDDSVNVGEQDRAQITENQTEPRQAVDNVDRDILSTSPVLSVMKVLTEVARGDNIILEDKGSRSEHRLSCIDDSDLVDDSCYSTARDLDSVEASTSSSVQEMFAALMSNLNKKFEGMEDRFTEVNKKIEKGNKQVNKNFEKIENQFTEVNKNFEGINRRFERIDKQFTEVKQQNKDLNRKLSGDLENFKIEINSKIENQAIQLKQLWEKDLKTLDIKVEKKITEVESQCKSISEFVKSELTEEIKKVAVENKQRVDLVKEDVQKVEQKVASVKCHCENEHEALHSKIVSENERCVLSIKSVSERVNAVEQLTSRTETVLHEHDSRLAKVEHNIRLGVNSGGCSVVAESSQVAYITNRQFLRFDPTGHVHPKEFWNDFESVLPGLWTDRQKIGFITSKFLGEARMWGAQAIEKYETLELYKEAFFNEYWGKQKQLELQNSFWAGEKYYPKKESVRKFALRWITNLSYLTHKLEPEQIIMGLEAKLPKHWRDKSIAGPRDDVNKFVSYLERVERLFQGDEPDNRNYRPQNTDETCRNVNVNKVGVFQSCRGRGARGSRQNTVSKRTNGEGGANSRPCSPMQEGSGFHDGEQVGIQNKNGTESQTAGN